MGLQCGGDFTKTIMETEKPLSTQVLQFSDNMLSVRSSAMSPTTLMGGMSYWTNMGSRIMSENPSNQLLQLVHVRSAKLSIMLTASMIALPFRACHLLSVCWLLGSMISWSIGYFSASTSYIHIFAILKHVIRNT